MIVINVIIPEKFVQELRTDFLLKDRCPFCKTIVVFQPIDIYEYEDNVERTEHHFFYADFINHQVHARVGIRICPSCRHVVFFHHDWGTKETFISPTPEIDFDDAGVPQPVASPLREAIKYHANECYVSAAIMIRKSLEMLCAVQEAQGNNLHQRIEGLKDRLTLTDAFFEAMHDLRYLGNDAAHIESRTYEDVGEEEVRVGIDVAKYIIRSVYVNESILRQLQALKRT